ncbi:hypothetical protein HPO_08354 [Hyphomonas polymorpha PS728]|uniref:SnoaL-like domain-containing protein n=1 Tax=Hyphomonas polymorpha PS728 TaxID=1280954 RepID=A0A062VHF4_9PROT|nr:hypothetical protein [Hyphomonas polymorpha]KCZ98897.1 hypothetical protein HPO_08354 [Hyphomonas polymorpha PS728]
MAETREETLRRFFQQYAKATREGDTEIIATSYAPTYIETSPDTFVAWKVDEQYRKALVERHTMLQQQLGLQALDVEIVSAEEVAPLHYMVRARWKMTFAKARAGNVTSLFDITYMVKIASKPQILAYISHESEEAVMRRDGVI